MSFSDTLKDLFFPFSCPSCGKKIKRSDVPLCEDCKTKYDNEKRALCRKCGRSNDRCVCMPEYRAGCFLCLSVFPYRKNSPGGRLILELKDRKNEKIAAFLAHDMAESLQNGCILREDALVTYVPRARAAVSENGVDQARELARCLSKELSLESINALVHIGAGKAQKTADAKTRALRAEKSYKLSRSCPDLTGRQIVLTDDIVTTGATLSACARLLHERGADVVICLSAGKTAKRE